MQKLTKQARKPREWMAWSYTDPKWTNHQGFITITRWMARNMAKRVGGKVLRVKITEVI